MSMSASEFLEAGLALPPAVRKDVAMRLLESVEATDQEVIDRAWTDEIALRVDDIVSGRVAAVPGAQVFADLEARLEARRAARGS